MPRIMVIDDNINVAKAIRRILEQRNHTTKAETDPERALTSILKWKPDLVVVNFDMPNVSGVDLCRAIRANKEIAELPILLTCEADHPHDIEAGFNAGANGCIVKPTDLPKIYSHIDELLSTE